MTFSVLDSLSALASLSDDCTPEEREFFLRYMRRAAPKARERIIDSRVDHDHQPVSSADLNTEEGLEEEAVAACRIGLP